MDKFGAFVITTDSNCDLLPEYILKNNIGVIPHYYDFNGTTYGDEINLTPKQFYERMRNGEMPTTMASNPAVIRETFTKYIEQGIDIIHISFSSALSGGHSNVATGAIELCDDNPLAKIVVIDSLNVSMGEGLLVMKAVELKEQGMGFNEVVEHLLEFKKNICVEFTVDDLFHLQRGGRLSKMSAIIGSMMNVKPLLIVNKDGALVANKTVRGRKKSLATLVDNMEMRLGSFNAEDYPICIVHGDTIEDANYIVNLIRERFEKANIVVNTVSPSIGAHSGPGAIGICFIGDGN